MSPAPVLTFPYIYMPFPKPVTATSQASANDVYKCMARQIEVLSDRLNVMNEDRKRLAHRLDDRDAMLAAANAEVEYLSVQVAALRAKLPPKPPAPPTAGETLAHCKQAIFPQER